MATTTNLTGPQYRLLSQYYNYYSMMFTYVVEDRNETAGTTTIRYSIYMTGKREDNINKYQSTGGVNYVPGDNVYYGPNNVYKPYKEEFPVITHWYTNPVTENTFFEKANTASTWTRAEIETIFNSGNSAYCRFWLLEDVYLVINDSDTYNLSFRFENSMYDYNISESIALGLNDFALLTNAPTAFTDEDSPVIQYTNLKGAETYSIDVAIVRPDTGMALVNPQYLPTERTLGEHKFVFTEAERERIYSYLSTTTSGKVRFELRSEYKGKINISTAEATLSLVNYSPVLAPTIVDTNETTLALTGNNKKFIRYHSRASFAINATGRKGASVISYYSTHNGAIYRGVTGAVNNVEVDSFMLSATDTRGITTKMNESIDLIAYTKLTCNVTAELPSNEDKIKVTASGNFWNRSFGAVNNTLDLYYRWKTNNNDNYTIWEYFSPGHPQAGKDGYNVTADIPVPNHVDRYTLQIKAVDKLSSVESKTVTVQAYPVFDWSDQDFNFNIPVTIQGDLTVTGTIHTPNALEEEDPVADFIVEQGTKTTGSGNSQANWVYRKWNSGIAECWCRKHVSTAVNTAWGNLFVSGALSYTNITWGVSFTDIPVANITIAPNASGAFLIAGGSTSLTKTNTGGYEIARGSALASAGNFYINYYAIGTWK